MITICVYLIIVLFVFLSVQANAQTVRISPNNSAISTLQSQAANALYASDTVGNSAKIMTFTKAKASIDSILNIISGKINSSDTVSGVVTPTSLLSKNYATNPAMFSRLLKSDTGAMLAPYMRTSALTLSLLTGILGSTYSTPSDISGKLNKTDTAAMLDNYRNAISTNALNISNLTTTVSGKQATLVSGTNIKTINGSSILGSGNLTVGDVTANSTTTFTNKSGNISQWTNDASYLTTATLPIGKADASTKGIVTFSNDYFTDNGAGKISFSSSAGSGSVVSNAVTVNSTRGKLTLTSPNILANANLAITFTNSYITSTSTITLGVNGNGAVIPSGIIVYVKSQSSGSCIINILNLNLLSAFTTSIGIDFSILN